MKVIIHRPSLPLLLAGILLDIPVVKATHKPKQKTVEDGEPLRRPSQSAGAATTATGPRRLAGGRRW
jgi:hypothetical protein